VSDATPRRRPSPERSFQCRRIFLPAVEKDDSHVQIRFAFPNLFLASCTSKKTATKCFPNGSSILAIRFEAPAV